MEYKVTQEQLVQFSRIYNTLLTIETKGENTIIMGDCLRAFQQSMQEVQNQPIPVKEPESNEENK